MLLNTLDCYVIQSKDLVSVYSFINYLRDWSVAQQLLGINPFTLILEFLKKVLSATLIHLKITWE